MKNKIFLLVLITILLYSTMTLTSCNGNVSIQSQIEPLVIVTGEEPLKKQQLPEGQTDESETEVLQSVDVEKKSAPGTNELRVANIVSISNEHLIQREAGAVALPLQNDSMAENDTNYLKETELAIITGINEERKLKGLSELVYNENLTKAARIRSEELCRTGHWDHTRPNWDSWITVLQNDVPTTYLVAGENLAMVSHNDPNAAYESDAAWWVAEWKNSPSHYENMIRTEFNEIGVGVYFTKDDAGKINAYATTLFAQIEQPKHK